MEDLVRTVSWTKKLPNRDGCTGGIEPRRTDEEEGGSQIYISERLDERNIPNQTRNSTDEARNNTDF